MFCVTIFLRFKISKMFIRESCLSAEIGSAAIPDIAKDAASLASLFFVNIFLTRGTKFRIKLEGVRNIY